MIKRLTAAICLMARKEDKDLLDSIDAAIDAMNVETPNWRTELYNEYYGSPSKNNDFTAEEQEYPAALKGNGAVIRAVMNPEGTPYSWYDGEEAYGIAADIFAATADRLGLAYEIVPVSTVVVGQYSAEIIQSNMETGTEENVVRYFYTHPEVSGVILIVAVAALMFLALYLQSAKNNKKQKQISKQLAAALRWWASPAFLCCLVCSAKSRRRGFPPVHTQSLHLCCG